jgi:hypothetical protein
MKPQIQNFTPFLAPNLIQEFMLKVEQTYMHAYMSLHLDVLINLSPLLQTKSFPV